MTRTLFKFYWEQYHHEYSSRGLARIHTVFVRR